MEEAPKTGSTREENDEFYEELTIQADPGQGFMRLDKFLVDRVERVSRNKIQNGIRAGAITVNGFQVKPNYKLKPLDLIRLVIPRSLEGLGKVVAQDIPLDILYEDASLLIVNKPAGMVVHPGIGNYDGTLVNALAYHFQDTEMPIMPGNVVDRPGLVHRIDKDTSGLLVIAKTEYAMTHLAKQFFDHSIERRYWALVWGEPEPREGTLVAHIGRHPRYRTRMMAYPDGDQGKHAVTHYRMLESFYYTSLLECQLETGRTHQIRVHLQWQGHPLFSDRNYGGDRILKGTIYSRYRQFVEKIFAAMPRQALHARTLGFIHPETKEKMHFEAPLPDDFQAALDLWRSWYDQTASNT